MADSKTGTIVNEYRAAYLISKQHDNQMAERERLLGISETSMTTGKQSKAVVPDDVARTIQAIYALNNKQASLLENIIKVEQIVDLNLIKGTPIDLKTNKVFTVREREAGV